MWGFTALGDALGAAAAFIVRRSLPTLRGPVLVAAALQDETVLPPWSSQRAQESCC